ncbi:MAG TPA: enoyl-CoA hydratase-related protein [Actinomycetes bacterium]|nr:enoyl-CoA hydratase-related protein [Actinomycetes bacterium]
MTDVLRYDHSDHVATVALNRPDAMNALNLELKEALRDALAEAGSDPGVRAVVLTGTGRAFCAGQDLKEHVELLERSSGEDIWQTVPRHYTPIATSLATMPKPVVAAVNGIAAGAGASLAFACDFRLTADSAAYNLAFSAIGLSADTGSTWTLQRLVGYGKAVEMLMLPSTIPAATALELGLTHHVVPADELAAAAAELAGRLAAGPTLAYAAIKRALAYSAAHPLPEALQFEGQMMAETGQTADHRNAVAAFVAKERPVFAAQ